MNRVRYAATFLACFLVFFVPSALAQTDDAEAAPGEIISKVTATLLTLAKETKSQTEGDDEKYFSELRSLLEPVIDFESIAKNVMGKKSWLSISEEEQQRFVNVFTDSLVNTYGKAMLSFADLDVQVSKTWPSNNPESKSYFVQQDVKLESGLAHIVYSMQPDDSGWKVRNVTIRDAKGYKLNMGKTFYSQFQHALSENDGNVSSTIDAWAKG